MSDTVWYLAYEEEGTEDAAWTIRQNELDDDGDLVPDNNGPWYTNAQIADGDDEAALAWASEKLGVPGDWKAWPNAGSQWLTDFWTHPL